MYVDMHSTYVSLHVCKYIQYSMYCLYECTIRVMYVDNVYGLFLLCTIQRMPNYSRVRLRVPTRELATRDLSTPLL